MLIKSELLSWSFNIHLTPWETLRGFSIREIKMKNLLHSTLSTSVFRSFRKSFIQHYIIICRGPWGKRERKNKDAYIHAWTFRPWTQQYLLLQVCIVLDRGQWETGCWWGWIYPGQTLLQNKSYLDKHNKLNLIMCLSVCFCNSPTTISVNSKPFFTDFLCTWLGRLAKPTYPAASGNYNEKTNKKTDRNGDNLAYRTKNINLLWVLFSHIPPCLFLQTATCLQLLGGGGGGNLDFKKTKQNTHSQALDICL